MDFKPAAADSVSALWADLFGGLAQCRCIGCPTNQHLEFCEGDLNELNLQYQWPEVERATHSFDKEGVVGGRVYATKLEDGVEVAIKLIEGPLTNSFKTEVQLLSRCHHPNVVMLLGFAMEEIDRGLGAESCIGTGRSRRALVYELLPGGNASQRLYSQSRPYPWHERVKTSIEAARGLAHLHRHRPELFHRDVKTANILFTRDGHAKIADFGFACASSHRDQRFSEATDACGTPGYAAPEYGRTGVVTEASEIYSMGMVLVELLTARAPAESMGGKRGGFRFLLEEIRPELERAKDRLMSLVDGRAGYPLHASAALGTFALTCIHDDVSRRPCFLDMVGVLQNVVDGAREQSIGLSVGVPIESTPVGASSDSRSHSLHDVDEATAETSSSNRAAALDGPVIWRTWGSAAAAWIPPLPRRVSEFPSMEGGSDMAAEKPKPGWARWLTNLGGLQRMASNSDSLADGCPKGICICGGGFSEGDAFCPSCGVRLPKGLAEPLPSVSAYAIPPQGPPLQQRSVSAPFMNFSVRDDGGVVETERCAQRSASLTSTGLTASTNVAGAAGDIAECPVAGQPHPCRSSRAGAAKAAMEAYAAAAREEVQSISNPAVATPVASASAVASIAALATSVAVPAAGVVFYRAAAVAPIPASATPLLVQEEQPPRKAASFSRGGQAEGDDDAFGDFQSATKTSAAVVSQCYPEHASMGRLHHICELSPE